MPGNIQAEPYLDSVLGQVSFYQEALPNIFSRGVDLKRYKDSSPMGFFVLMVRYFYQEWLINLIWDNKVGCTFPMAISFELRVR